MFGDLSSFSKDYIKRAELSLCECSNSLAGKTIHAYRITSDWDRTELCWNNQPAFDGTAVGQLTTKGGFQTSTMDLRGLFQDYVNGTYSNFGIKLRNPNETSSSYFTSFFGVRHATMAYRPKLIIEHYERPTSPTVLSLEKSCIKADEEAKLSWKGITAPDLDYIQYRVAEFDEKNNIELSKVKEYSANTKIGTDSEDTVNLPLWENIVEGSHKTYKIFVRGVSTTGAEGDERGVILHVDNAIPTGNIRVVASGTGEETNVLKDTVSIIGEVDGTGSDVEENYMKLYQIKEDGTMEFVRDIYTNQTVSKGQTVFTPDLENGQYRLIMYMKDAAGFENQVQKDITVTNTLSSPVVKTTYTNDNTAVLEWDFPYASVDVKQMAYKFVNDEEWTVVEGTSGTSGSFEISLPEAEGSYEVRVCGIDETDTYGADTIVSCIVDKTLPDASFTRVERGMVYGTIQDTYLSHWELYLKQEESETSEVILTGKRAVSNGYIGILDLEQLEPEVSYELILKAYDKAGNETSVSQSIQRQLSDVPVTVETPAFSVKRPYNTAHSMNHIVFPAATTKIELATLPMLGSIPSGTVRWFCNGALVSTQAAWTGPYPSMLNQNHTILSVIENGDVVKYSQERIVNKEILSVDKSRPVFLPENCVSFRLNTGETSVTAQVAIDGIVTTIQSGETIHVVQATNGTKATADSVKLIAVSVGTYSPDWTIEADTVEEETFSFSEIENYHPLEVGVKDKLNYKTYLRWEGFTGDCPEGLSYEIYRGEEPGFIPNTYNLLASNVKANYWAEMNINYSHNFYYKIRAVKKDSYGRVVEAGSFSNEVVSEVIDVEEYVKRMGLKEYWEYAEFDTPSGNGYIEKSRGNLVYTQVDAQIPNEQLPVTLERTYNSQSTAKTAFGVGWTHTFDLELLEISREDASTYSNIVLKDGTGTLFFFNKNADGTYTSSMGKYMTLKKEEKNEEVELPETTVGVADKTKKVKVISAFTMKTKDNVEYRFNSSGQLIYMAEANGNFLLFEYDSKKGLLSKLTTSKNLSMEFVYYTQDDYVAEDLYADVLTIKEVCLPDGSKVAYEYLYDAEGEVHNDRLAKVTKTGTDKTSTQTWTMDYNTSKQMTSISDACRNLYTVDYQGDKAERITYPNGEAIALVYDEEQEITKTYKEVQENGETVSILLETNTFAPTSGNSIKMEDCNGTSVTYEYEDDMRSKAIYTSVYWVEEDGQIVKKEETKTDTISYSERDNVKEEVDEDGVKTTYEYGITTGPLKDLPTNCVEVNKEGYEVTNEVYTYDGCGNVIMSVDDVSKRVVETEYYTEDDPDEGHLKGEVKSRREYFLYDESNPSSSESTYKYDEIGQKTEVMTETAGQFKAVTTTIYDVMGRQIRSTDTRGEGTDSNVTTTTETIYDPFGRVAKVKATQGNITDEIIREYNDNGALIREVKEDGTIYLYTYDNMNRLTSQTIQKGEESKTWNTEYSHGSVTVHTRTGLKTVDHVFITTEKNPNGEILSVTYTDTLGRVLRQKQNGLYVDYEYDEEGKVTASYQLGTEPDRENPLITAYLYDVHGNISGQVLKPGYDEATGRFTVTGDSLTQYMTYDSVGNMTSVTNGVGNFTSYTYDYYGRVTSVTQKPSAEATEATVTSYAYDQFDAATKNGSTQTIVTDAMGRTSVTTYDILGHVTSISDKGDGSAGTTAITQTYTYDSKRRTSTVKDGNGNVTAYSYDGKDRLIQVSYKDSSGTEVLRTRYTYDKSDNVTTMLDYTVSGGTATLYRYTGFTYDYLKRLTELFEINTTKTSGFTEAERKEHTTKYTYDLDGNLTSVMYPESDWEVKGLRYTYNSDKWLTGIEAVMDEDQTARFRNYAYNEFGSVEKITDYRVLSSTGEIVTDPDYTECIYTYDSYLRPVSMVYKDSTDPTTIKEAYTYEYDKNNRLVRETLLNLYPENPEDKQNETRTYSYDSLGRLLQTTVTDQLHAEKSYISTYSYDTVGNRLTHQKVCNGQAENTTNTYNSLNQLTGSVTTNGTGTITENSAYQYDGSGNQIKVTDSIGSTEQNYTYDPAGRLASFVKKENGVETVTQSNQYNGSGARIRKTENNTTIHYYYNQGSVLYTEDGNGKENSLNLTGVSGNIIATARDEENTESYYYYHKDPAGSITNLRDADGKSIVSYQYTDFGETTIYGDTDFYNEICYNEAIYDKNTGLYYLSARYYDPENGRFISRDSYRGTAGNPSSLHLYTYCANNPVNYEDPSGHIALSRIIGGIVGAVSGAWAGSKIAKKTNAKGLKKAAIIAGCTVAGGAVGAIAGPRVAKLAKKVVSYTKPKLKTVKSTLQKITSKKANLGSQKKVTKTKTAVSTSKKTLKLASKNGGTEGRLLKNKIRDTMLSGIYEGAAEYMTGGKFVDGLQEGMITGTISSVGNMPMMSNLIGGFVGGFYGTRDVKSGKERSTRIIVNTLIQGVVGGAMGKMADEIGVDKLWNSQSVSDRIGVAFYEHMAQVFGGGFSLAGDAACDVAYGGAN